MWMVLSFFCAGYAFMGIGVIGYASTTNNALVISLAAVAWLLDFVVLRIANKRW